MRYISDLPNTEGSVLGPRYNRAGSRTPMQWDQGPNAGFSTAPTDRLYLPVDPDPSRPTVETQRADPGSLLHLVRRLITLRASAPGLGTAGEVEILNDGHPFTYVRGGRHLIVVNPCRAPASFRASYAAARPIEVSGVTVTADTITAGAFAYAVLELP